MIDGKKHKPGVMDNCIKPILNLTNDLSVLMSVNVSILKILLFSGFNMILRLSVSFIPFYNQKF